MALRLAYVHLFPILFLLCACATCRDAGVPARRLLSRHQHPGVPQHQQQQPSGGLPRLLLLPQADHRHGLHMLGVPVHILQAQYEGNVMSDLRGPLQEERGGGSSSSKAGSKLAVWGAQTAPCVISCACSMCVSIFCQLNMKAMSCQTCGASSKKTGAEGAAARQGRSQCCVGSADVLCHRLHMLCVPVCVHLYTVNMKATSCLTCGKPFKKRGAEGAATKQGGG